MSPSLFIKMVDTMDAQQVTELPESQLPDDIPETWLENLPAEKRAAVESRLFESASTRVRQRISFAQRYTEEAATAIAIAVEGSSKTYTKQFDERLQSLQISYDHWKMHGDSKTRDQLKQSIKQMDIIGADLRSESRSLVDGIAALEACKPENSKDARTFSEAKKQLRKQIKLIDTLLSDYYIIRLMVQGLEIQRAEDSAEETQKKIEELERQARSAKRKIHQHKLSKRLSDQDAKMDPVIIAYQNEIDKLREEENKLEHLISETNLIHWLDLVVDAVISNPGKVQQSEAYKKAQMSLFQLLVRYCRSQEQAAQDVADSPFAQVDPERTIQFMFKSEAFILNYFAKKRDDLGQWLGDAASGKLNHLDKIEANLLNVLRKNLAKSAD
ncbi:MAG: hypothetical protein ACQES2_02645 [Pseudomonadota bacterium]